MITYFYLFRKVRTISLELKIICSKGMENFLVLEKGKEAKKRK